MLRPTSTILSLLSFAVHHVIAQDATPGPGKFFFMWPTQVSQCQLVNLTWGAGAVAPFQAWVVPIGQQPFIYHIPASAYSNGQGQYQIQVQLNQGTNYVMLMSDARGIGSGGTSALQIVSSSPNTACLNTASRNQTSKAFSYSVAGKAQQCSPGFELQWDGSPDQSPYNFTVIPLTQSYYPFDVVIDEKSGYSSDWVLNMTSGTRFTVLMNNKDQYGSGGAAGIYEVANNNSRGTACITQSAMGTGAWPVGVATNTLARATISARPTTEPSSGIKGGAIAGIVIGIIALIAIIAAIVLLLLRRKRKAIGTKRNESKLDLADGDLEGYTETEGEGYHDPHNSGGGLPLVSPYPTSTAGGRYSAVPMEERRGSEGPEGYGGDLSDRGTMTSAGFAGLGMGGEGNRDSRITMDQRRGEGTSTEAGALPLKSAIVGQFPSSTPTISRQSPPLPATIPLQTPNLPSSDSKSRGSSSMPQPGIPMGAMRVVNHDHPEDIPAVDPNSGQGTGGRRRESREAREDRQMQFRRHEDAGRVDIVDLPPLYTDVPRERSRLSSIENRGGQARTPGGSGERSPFSPESAMGSREDGR